MADKNEFEAYRYKKEKLRGKKVSSKRIKGVKTDDYGSILMYSGCSIQIIIKLTSERIAEKDRKARRRLASCPNCSVELCLCIIEGGLLDKHSFELYLRNLNSFVFKRYFFITRSFLFVYDEATGFTEYER